MARYAIDGRIGVSIEGAETSPKVPVGTIVRGFDDVANAEGEYMYVQFNAATTEGQAVYLDLTNKSVLADSAAHANDGGPIGFALQAQAANSYGFVQIGGKAKAKAGAVVAGAKVFLTAVPGTVDDAVLAGNQLLCAEFDTADGTPAAGFAYVSCSRPNVQGQIT